MKSNLRSRSSSLWKLPSLFQRMSASMPRTARFILHSRHVVSIAASDRMATDSQQVEAMGVRRLKPERRQSHMELDMAALGQLGIGAVAVDLQRAAEAREMLGRP